VPTAVIPWVVPRIEAVPTSSPAHIDIYIYVGAAIVEVGVKVTAYKHNYIIGSRYDNA
jgi:hypothetical protein